MYRMRRKRKTPTFYSCVIREQNVPAPDVGHSCVGSWVVNDRRDVCFSRLYLHVPYRTYDAMTRDVIGPRIANRHTQFPLSLQTFLFADSSLFFRPLDYQKAMRSIFEHRGRKAHMAISDIRYSM